MYVCMHAFMRDTHSVYVYDFVVTEESKICRLYRLNVVKQHVVTNFFLSLCRSVTNAAPDLIFVSLHLSKSREYIYLRLKKYVVCFVNRVGCACLEGRALFGREGPVFRQVLHPLYLSFRIKFYFFFFCCFFHCVDYFLFIYSFILFLFISLLLS